MSFNAELLFKLGDQLRALGYEVDKLTPGDLILLALTHLLSKEIAG